MTIEDRINENIAKARSRAEEGNSGFETFIISAKIKAQTTGMDVSEQVEEIQKMGYKNSVQVQLEYARSRAEEGNYAFRSASIPLAQIYAKEAGIDITEQVEEINEIGYKNALNIDLKKARERAEKGNIGFERFLKYVQINAPVAGMDFSDQVEEIQEMGYKNALNIEIELARITAERGNPNFQNSLEKALEYAQKAVMDVSEQVEEIKETGYKNALEIELENAKFFVTRGNPKFQNSLEKALEYAQITGMDVSEQVGEIQALYIE